MDRSERLPDARPNLAETGRYTRFAATQDYVPEAIRTPMYPAFVALLDLVFGQSRVVIASAQAVLFAIICVLVYEIARAATTELIALAAGLATALCPPLPYFGALCAHRSLHDLPRDGRLWPSGSPRFARTRPHCSSRAASSSARPRSRGRRSSTCRCS